MAEKGSSDKIGKSGGRKAAAARKTPVKSSPSRVSSGKSKVRSTSKMANESMESGKRGNRRTIGIIITVLVILALCCICTLAVLWYTGDSIIEFFNISF